MARKKSAPDAQKNGPPNQVGKHLWCFLPKNVSFLGLKAESGATLWSMLTLYSVIISVPWTPQKSKCCLRDHCGVNCALETKSSEGWLSAWRCWSRSFSQGRAASAFMLQCSANNWTAVQRELDALLFSLLSEAAKWRGKTGGNIMATEREEKERD